MAQRPSGGSVSVLGPLRLEIAGAPVSLRPAQRRLLAILLLDPEASLDRDTLTDRMWGDAMPATAASALQVHLSGIRRQAPALLRSADGGYRLDLDGWRFDRTSFERLVSEAAAHGRDGTWERALRASERAAGLWRGTPYQELADDDFAAADRARLMAAAEGLSELRAGALVALGRLEEAVVELQDAVHRHPLREPLWEQLMLALSRSGRQAEALRAFQEARRVLDTELGVEPGARLRELEQRIAWGDEAAAAPGPSTPTNLPWIPTSFVGREDDLAEVAGLVEHHRLVTLVGGPGIGKTRLAIEAGRMALGTYPDGVWLVSLIEARTELDVAVAIARAVGLTAQTVRPADLERHLAGRRMLLILDNCEHVAAASADVARRLAGTSVRILATSRRALGLPDEAVWRVTPLPPPGDDDDPATALRGSPAVRLFVDRARAADRGYRLTPESAPLVAALCRRADGIPLALELAAAWIPWLGLADIEEMLTADETPRRGRSATADHHRSLRAAIEWSLALLAPSDRRLFLAASIFRGTFDLGDAVAVCAANASRRDVGPTIARLVDASLLVARRRPDGSLRYHTLVPIREYARELLAGEASGDGIRDRFVTHYLGKTHRQQRDPFGEVAALDGVDEDLDNLREAFELGIEAGRADDVARALVPLDMYWRNRYLGAEGRRWCARVLPLVTDPNARAGVLASAAIQAQVTNDLDEALRLFREAVAAYEHLDDPIGLGRCLLALAGLHCNRGEWAAGLAAARKGRRIARAASNEAAIAVATHWIGKNLASAGDLERGLDSLVTAARMAEATGESSRASHYASTVTLVAVLSGNETIARSWANRGIVLARQAGSAVRLARALGASAALEGRWGDPLVAREQLTEVDGMLANHEGNEHLFEFLFPAALLLRRCERWSLLAEVIEAVEAAIAHTAQGYGEPWEGAAAAWKAEAAAETGGAATSRPRSVDVLTDEVRQFLAGMA